MRKNILLAIASLSFITISTCVLAELYLNKINYKYSPLKFSYANETKTTDWRFYHSFKDGLFAYDPDLFWANPNNKQKVYTNNYLIELWAEFKSKEPNEYRVLVLGDSNTQLNWPLYLWLQMLKQGWNATLLNGGTAGYTSFQGLRQLEKLNEFDPDLILVCFGVNDAHKVVVSDTKYANHFFRKYKLDTLLVKTKIGQLFMSIYDRFLFSVQSSKFVRRVDFSSYKDNLQKMIDITNDRGAKIAFVSRPFFAGATDFHKLYLDDYLTYNKIAKDVANQNGVEYVDIFKIFANNETAFIDATHLKDKAHLVMALSIHEKLNDFYPKRADRDNSQNL